MTAAPSNTSRSSEQLASLAVACLDLEIDTWPKPGLVSHVDRGSHDDMDAATFRRSAAALRPYFAELAEAGRADRPMHVLRKVGLRAERAMLAATGGVNTHRGAIFGLGLLCAAAGRGGSLGETVAGRWGDAIRLGPRPSSSHGEVVARLHGTGGARSEAARGFPSVYRIGVPALRDGRRLAPHDPEAARVHACLSLIAVVDDTNLLHRGGADGLRFARDAATRFIESGGVARATWRDEVEAMHRAFIERRLSPGGSADLLAMSLFVAACER